MVENDSHRNPLGITPEMLRVTNKAIAEGIRLFAETCRGGMAVDTALMARHARSIRRLVWALHEARADALYRG